MPLSPAFSPLPASYCPDYNKPDHVTPAEPMALDVAVPVSLGAAGAAGPGDGGPANEAAGEAEMEETDGEGDRCCGRRKGEKGGGCHPRRRCQGLWYEVRVKLWSIVESKYFNRGIMIAILINTISMGIEHHQQVGCCVRYV